MTPAPKGRLELTWMGKGLALIPSEHGKYDYTWVDPTDPRVREIKPLVITATHGATTGPGNAHDNLLITGDSGDVLRTLTHVPELADKYLGTVKLIYIDPPFNTKQAFDHYADQLEHSVWLTMMRDHLVSMKKLLRLDGSIWVHLDYSENHRMRSLLDEVFGADMFAGEVVWQKADSPRSDGGKLSVDQDVILVYRATNAFKPNRLPRKASRDALYGTPDGDPNAWISGDPAAPGADRGARQHPGVYGIQNPVTGEMIYPARGRVWSNQQDRVWELLQETASYTKAAPNLELRAQMTGIATHKLRDDVPDLVLDQPFLTAADIYAGRPLPRLYFTKGGSGGLKMKKYLEEIAQDRAAQTWWTKEDVGHNRGAKKEITALFPNINPFSTPKPEALLQRIIQIATNPGDLVLDTFAGSGTTAAVAHKMGRRWITVELQQSTVDTFIQPRLDKVINGQDPGGITTTTQREASTTLPDGMTPDDAATFQSLLRKVAADPRATIPDTTLKHLRALTKTKNTTTTNWAGGGGYTTATLQPSMYHVDDATGLVLFTENATNGTWSRSVAAQLRYPLTTNDPIFIGARGRQKLMVVDGIVDEAVVEIALANLAADETVAIVGKGALPGVDELVRSARPGSRVRVAPEDLFAKGTIA